MAYIVTGGATKHCNSNGSFVTVTFWLEEKPTLGRIRNLMDYVKIIQLYVNVV